MYYDRERDELGRVPYTPTFFAALGTVIARKFNAIQSAPYKVIVLDCDQTLWKGICGEDGPLGIEIDPPRKKLQEFMVRQLEAGMLICLCSKNNEADVIEVFDHHPEMPLKRDHIVTWRINWGPKSENIKALANELQLGSDSFIFIDDSPIECAQVQANCPEVLTLLLPKEAENIPRFLEHVWAFDHLKITEEDKKRTTLYQENIKREHLLRESLTLGDFLSGLELKIEISEAKPNHLPRVAQLTQRTNQFNLTTIRRSEAEIQKLCQSGELECLVVEVSDRFGDYGLVGVILFETASDSIKVDTFLESCRAMGRGVEYRMLARLGEIANERGLGHVEVTYVPTKKNQPALDFMNAIGPGYKEAHNNGLFIKFPAKDVQKITYIPGSEKANPSNELPNKESSFSQILSKDSSYTRAKSERFGHIATNLNNAEQILRVIEPKHFRKRPDLPNEYVAPGNELERSITKIWQNILGIEKVGIQDNFFEIGGTSLKGVRLIAQLRREFNISIPFVKLFESPTISSLARMLGEEESQRAWNDNICEIRERGEKRRAKRISRKAI
jgi:FkbH-like protein